jgi:2-ketoarginine methyltransferase
MIPPEFEQQLIEGIQPIRQFAVAQVLFHLMDNGVLDVISQKPGITTDAVAGDLNLDPERLHEALRLLRNDGYLVDSAGWTLTGKGTRVLPLHPWYTLLVGSYTQTYLQLGDLLKADAPYGDRDGACAGKGSCGISMYDALPLDLRLLDKLESAPLVVDIGAGDGDVLVELCRRRPGLRGIAIEPDAPSVALVREHIKTHGMQDRIEAHHVVASTAVPSLSLPTDQPICFLAAFSLQEMLEQEGTDAVRDLLRNSVQTYPDAHWIVVEVDYRPDDEVMRYGLGLAYYTPYYLMHAITEQRLETKEFWQNLFAEAGLEQVALEYPDPGADSTRLLMGFLLRRAAQ